MKKLIVIAAIVLMAGVAQGALLQGYTAWHQTADGSVPGVYEYTSMTVWGKSNPCEYTADGSGIVGYNGQTEVLATSLHECNVSQWQTNWWQGGSMANIDATREYLVYEFDEVKSLGNMYLWNGNQNDKNTVSVKDFNIMISSDADPRTATWSQLGGGQVLNAATAGQPIAAQAFAMNVDARLVMVDIQSSWGANGWCGLSEAAFSEGGGAPPVPEPAGLGLVGLALLAVRKRRS